MTTQRLFLSLLLALSAPMALAGPQSAVVTCQTSNRQGNLTDCSDHATVTLLSEAADLIYGMKLSAPPAHCSTVAYGVVKFPYGTGADVIGMTGFLNAGQTETLILGRNWAPGTHELRIIATGVVGGCNAGALQSWGVNWEQVIVPE